MRKIIYILAIVFVFWGCSENERLLFTDGYRVYFEDIDDDLDSMTITMIALKEDKMTVNIPITLLAGSTFDESKQYKIEVLSDKSDAEAGLHYEAFSELQEFPANSVTAYFPLTVLKKDSVALAEKSVLLTLRLGDSGEMQAGYNDRIEMRIFINNMMRIPEDNGSYWCDMYAFIRLFGAYSQVKHQLIIDMTGHDFWDESIGWTTESTTNWIASTAVQTYYTYYAKMLYKYIAENEVIDENGDVIELWY